jgi:flagellar basal body-associated protein FliL
MDPFGNFGWSFGFGFGWILIGVTVIFVALAIFQLVRFSFQDDGKKAQEEAKLNPLKEICANEITVEEFEEEHGLS